MRRANRWMALFLILALLSGLALVHVRNQTRQFFAAWQNEKNQEIRLMREKVFLESQRAQLNNTQRIRQLAHKKGLVLPNLTNSYMIENHHLRNDRHADSQ